MKKVKRILAFILVAIMMMCTLIACGEDEEHTCLKCNGSGKVRDEYGYYAYVTCPRCHGAGSLEY